jgi:hypothetical protein
VKIGDLKKTSDIKLKRAPQLRKTAAGPNKEPAAKMLPASDFSWDFAGRRPIPTGQEAYRT